MPHQHRIAPGAALAAVLSMFAIFAVAPCAAQGASPTLALEGGAVYSALAGRDFRNVNEGVGYDVQASLGVDAFALGGGYERTNHGVDGADGKTVVSGVYLEPRLALPITTRTSHPTSWAGSRASRRSRT